MKHTNLRQVYVGETPVHVSEHEITGEYVSILGETFYKIRNFDGMPPFFMSIVSSTDHWLFISSSGGLSAGRVSAEQALFPYYTDDKITENHENTGSKAILLVTREDRTRLWEPLSERYRGNYQIERNIYKNITGTAILFEEINYSLEIAYRYAWRTSDKFGFVKTSWLINLGQSACHVEFLDGIQNILPANVTSQTQNVFSQLLDAYKRSEVDLETGLAIFALNSTLTDLAEPSESLLATTAMQLGLNDAGYLLSSLQLDRFRQGKEIETEAATRGQRGAYFVHAEVELDTGEERSWHIVADVSQDSAAMVNLSTRLRQNRFLLLDELQTDMELNNSNLVKIVNSADGIQISADQLCTAHHFANVMFNVMRGGIFSDQYTIRKQDFIEFIQTRNHFLFEEHNTFFENLPEEMTIQNLLAAAEESDSADLIRLSYSYLPLSFSRRHGDPSRPWNRFMIDIKKPDGSLKQGYEGNWRDIFQNWEALAYSYPEYVESMICTFLNATTADGYNPYRITQHGIDWEHPEPGNPWANIGYWSDHQIIYLLKLMEISTKLHPGKLESLLSKAVFSIANVPYRIKHYADILEDPFNTIDFNWDLEKEIMDRVKQRGSDGKLVWDENRQVVHVALAEKLLTLLLAKLVNLVPEGGIWMNTQRPEWNDANNALVGKGLSVVTLCYLRRFVDFYKTLLGGSSLNTIELHQDVENLYRAIYEILKQFLNPLHASFSDIERRSMMDALGEAGSDYRWNYYSQGLSKDCVEISRRDLIDFLELTQKYVEHSLRANKRSDNLYHAYNILHFANGSSRIGRLPEMLEGQVSILSSGMLSGQESLELLESLRTSRLYRSDQHSYILYPDRDLPGFLERNTITAEQLNDIPLIAELAKVHDTSLIVMDGAGYYHFSGHIHNAKDLKRALNRLQSTYSEWVRNDSEKILSLFEDIFHHNEFTGRSGTFFAYEGLGSIYWHMVSKLLLAVQETVLRTRCEPSTEKLKQIYADIRTGLCFNKSPGVYGAFPTDPYSHTPKGQGAKQPGMTGLVKEEILTRQAELGVSVARGELVFDTLLFDQKELLYEPSAFTYLDLNGQTQTVTLEPHSLAYTICQTPVVIRSADREQLTIHYSDGTVQTINGNALDDGNTRHIFQRDGVIHHLTVEIK